MSIYDLTASTPAIPVATPGGPAGFPAQAEGFSYRIKAVVDLSKIGTALAAADIVKVLNVPPGAVVKGAWVRVLTPCAAAMTLSLGDSGAGAGWIALTAMNAAAGTVLPPAGANLNAGAGKVYAAADYVGLVVAGTTLNNSGIFEVTARIERLY